MFGTEESKGKDSSEDRKFLEIRASIIWIYFTVARKDCFGWGPCSELFPLYIGRKGTEGAQSLV